jgi:hypothetical protein
MLGFSFGLFFREGSDTSATTGWKTVGNCLGRAPLGGSELDAWTSWTDGKLWEIAWGELRWEEARLKSRQGGQTGNRGK